MVDTAPPDGDSGDRRDGQGALRPSSPGDGSHRAAAVHDLVNGTAVLGCGAHSATEAAIQALLTLCLEDLLTGDWDELLRVADEAVALCETHGYRELRWPLWLARGIVVAARGQEPEGRELADRIDHWGSRRAVAEIQLYARFLRCQIAQASGDYDLAFREISVLGTPSIFSANVSLSLWASLDFVSCAVRTKRHDEAEAFVALTNSVDAATLSPRVNLLTRCATAITVSTSSLVCVRSLTTPGIDRWPFDVARLELTCGERLRRERTVAAARTHLARASAIFEQLRAQPWHHRAQQELRASGGPRRRPERGHEVALTPQEREIAEFAARGLTNRQIATRVYASHRTVSAHLYRIFPKLGITSRAALRDALAERDLGPTEGVGPVRHPRLASQELRPG
jgi:DNA-binding CsgD family transcriptional regulator